MLSNFLKLKKAKPFPISRFSHESPLGKVRAQIDLDKLAKYFVEKHVLSASEIPDLEIKQVIYRFVRAC